MIFKTDHMIQNVNDSNNKYYFDKDDVKITISERSYKLQIINKFLNIFYGNDATHSMPMTTPTTTRTENTQ